MGEFGHALRRLRREGDITLEQLSEATRIRALHIEALESERFQELPSDASARGFVRLLARQLKGDERQLLELFEQALVPHGPVSQPTPLAQTNTTLFKVQSGRRHTGLGIGVGVVVAVLLLFGWMRASQEPIVTSAKPGSPAPPQIAAVTPVAPSTARTTQAPPHRDSAASSTAGETAAAPAPSRQPPATARGGGDLGANGPTAPFTGDSVRPSSLQAAGYPLRLEVAASEQSWIQAEVDNGELREALLQPGERLIWTALEQMKLTVGNAGGLSLTFNGELIPLLGDTGQVVRLHFTDEGLQGKKGSARAPDPPKPQTSPRPESLPPSALAF